MEGSFPVENRNASQLVASLNTLPSQPTIIVLQPEVRHWRAG